MVRYLYILVLLSLIACGEQTYDVPSIEKENEEEIGNWLDSVIDQSLDSIMYPVVPDECKLNNLDWDFFIENDWQGNVSDPFARLLYYKKGEKAFELFVSREEGDTIISDTAYFNIVKGINEKAGTDFEIKSMEVDGKERVYMQFYSPAHHCYNRVFPIVAEPGCNYTYILKDYTNTDGISLEFEEMVTKIDIK